MKSIISTILLNLKLNQKSSDFDLTVTSAEKKEMVDASGPTCLPTLR